MEIFQFFINPEEREDLAFDCFCFEPKNFYEKKLGNLFIIGFIEGPPLKNFQLLTETARFLKESFYRKSSLGQEKALREALKEGNAFLEEKIKNEHWNWLGKMNFAILNLKDYKINLTKVGKMKIQLIRGKKLYDLDQRIKKEKRGAYFFRFFGKILTGRLLKDDIILIENKEIFDFFKKEGIFKTLEKMFPFNEREFKSILEEKKEKLKKISGVCFVLFLSEKIKERRGEIPSKEKEFSLFENLKFVLNKMKIIRERLQEEVKFLLSNAKWRLILIFVFFLSLAFFIFNYFFP